MSQASDYVENKLVDHVNGTAAYTMPTVYLALYTTSPTDADSGTEVTGGSGPYARKAIAFNAAAAGSASNTANVDFTGMPAVTVSHWATRDALTSGNMLVWGQFASPVVVTAGQTFRVEAGTLTITAS